MGVFMGVNMDNIASFHKIRVSNITLKMRINFMILKAYQRIVRMYYVKNAKKACIVQQSEYDAFIDSARR
jgi:hypothetical protein